QVQHRYNAASVLSEGRVLETYAKRELPNYQVFDEYRYFTRGQGTCVFQVEDVSVGLLICEDAWFEEPAQAARAPAFVEDLFYVTATPGATSYRLSGPMAADHGDDEELWHALVMGVR